MAVKKKTAKKTVKKKTAAKKATTKKKKVVKKTPTKKAAIRKKTAPVKAVHRPATVKKLHISKKDKMVAGVCGGIGEYLGIDPNVVRLLWILVSLLGGFWSIITSVIVYGIAAKLMPKE